MLHHEEQLSCKRNHTEYEEIPADGAYPLMTMKMMLLIQNPFLYLETMRNLLDPFQPMRSVTDHFGLRPGRNLSNKSQTFFADELYKCGYGARQLVIKAFDNKAHLLHDDELPSTSETYVHLLITPFMLTLSLPQKDAFANILSILIPNVILQGQTGTSPIFSSGST
jgi:hypothetical protein